MQTRLAEIPAFKRLIGPIWHKDGTGFDTLRPGPAAAPTFPAASLPKPPNRAARTSFRRRDRLDGSLAGC
ncbi:hypothetical protein GCM10010973_09520 [Cribrihabitans marinus]|nr:hypothetical protein GCM10010973_09520 [Cribrihabitans marinus]